LGINLPVNETIESHRRTSGKDHTEQNTDEIKPTKGDCRRFSMCHHIGEQRKWQGKERVRESD
jgi:hypothetical protein